MRLVVYEQKPRLVNIGDGDMTGEDESRRPSDSDHVLIN